MYNYDIDKLIIRNDGETILIGEQYYKYSDIVTVERDKDGKAIKRYRTF